MTQKQLAARLGVSEKTVARWEKGERKGGVSQAQLRALADALDCSTDHLLMIGLSMMTGSDVELAPLTPFARAIQQRGLRIYRVISDVLAEVGINVGDEITVDETSSALSGRHAGDVLLVRVQNPNVLILRQFLPPGLLTTNRPGSNQSFRLSDAAARAVIVGVVLRGDADPASVTNGTAGA